MPIAIAALVVAGAAAHAVDLDVAGALLVEFELVDGGGEAVVVGDALRGVERGAQVIE